MPQIFKSGANTTVKICLLALGFLPVAVFGGGSLISRSPANTNVEVPLNQPVPFSHKHHVMELGIDCRFCHVSVEDSKHASVPPSETCMTCHAQIWTNSPLLEPVRKSYAEGTPIIWNKLNKVPEFVYFDHSIHIDRGINCNTCHGPVQEMHITFKGKNLSMSWCLECHREPEKYIRDQAPGKNISPQEQVFQLYRNLQAHKEESLSDLDKDLVNGEALMTKKEDIEGGEKLLEKYKINKKQLMDCWVCHR